MDLTRYKGQRIILRIKKGFKYEGEVLDVDQNQLFLNDKIKGECFFIISDITSIVPVAIRGGR